EVDRFGRNLLGRDRQVALVLAVFIVNDDDHAARTEGLDGVLDAGERAAFARAFCDLDAASHQCLTSPAPGRPSERPASSAARATYFPTMSHSRLTRSRFFTCRRFVCAFV